MFEGFLAAFALFDVFLIVLGVWLVFSYKPILKRYATPEEMKAGFAVTPNNVQVILPPSEKPSEVPLPPPLEMVVKSEKGSRLAINNEPCGLCDWKISFEEWVKRCKPLGLAWPYLSPEVMRLSLAERIVFFNPPSPIGPLLEAFDAGIISQSQFKDLCDLFETHAEPDDTFYGRGWGDFEV